ncbi:hypothetical protein VPHK469_0014 [Vibrio phage K469]
MSIVNKYSIIRRMVCNTRDRIRLISFFKHD